MSPQNVESCPAMLCNKAERNGKLLTTVLLGLTNMILTCAQKIPNHTVSLLGVHLGPIEAKGMRRMRIVFSFRQFGYICGFVCGGLSYDHYILPMEKQVLTSSMLLVVAITTVFIPFYTTMNKLGILFFISGFSRTFIVTGINAYIMGMYGLNSNTGIQFIYACNLLGKVVTDVGTRNDYRHLLRSINLTQSYEVRREGFTKLFISYSTLGIFLTILSIAWICLYRFSPEDYNNHVPFNDSRQEKTKLGFQTLAIVTTVPLLMIASFLDFSHSLLIRYYASNKFHRNVGRQENIPLVHLISMMAGRILSIFVAYKLLSPGWMITVSLSVQLFAACLMPLIGKFREFLMWAVVVLVGLSSAALLPTTIAWLNAHIMVTGKICACLFAANVISLMTIPVWLNETLSTDPDSPLYYMFLVPIFYTTIFIIQALLFRREQNLEYADPNSRETEEKHRCLDCLNRQVRKPETDSRIVPQQVTEP